MVRCAAERVSGFWLLLEKAIWFQVIWFQIECVPNSRAGAVLGSVNRCFVPVIFGGRVSIVERIRTQIGCIEDLFRFSRI